MIRLPPNYQLVLTDAQGFITWANASFCEATGYRLDEVLGRRPGAVLQGPLSDPKQIARMHDGVASGAGCYGVEITHYRQDGAPFLVRLDIEPQHDPSGRLTGFASVQRDISLDLGDRQRLTLLDRWYRSLATTRALGLWERNLRTGEGRWDSVTFELWGLPISDLAPSLEACHTLILPEDRLATPRDWLQDYWRNEAGKRRFRIRLADGRLRVLESRWTLLGTGDGDTVSVGSTQDVTEATEREERDRLRQAQLLMAVQAAGIGLWVEDWSNGHVTWNDAALTIFGPTDPALAGPLCETSGDHVIHAEDRPALLALRARLREHGGDGELRYRLVREDGEIRHILTRRTTFADASGRPKGVKGVVMDLTDQVLTQERLQLLTDELQQAMAVAQLGIWRHRAGEACFSFDTNLMKMYGQTDAAAALAATTGTTPFNRWVELIQPEDRDRMRALWDAIVEGTRPQGTTDFGARGPGGAPRTFRTSWQRIAGHSGSYLGSHGVSRDVTQELQAERARLDISLAVAARDRSEASSLERTSVLSMVSHDMRAPLAAVMAGVEHLQSQDVEATVPTARQWLHTMDAASRQLLALAEDLLESARHEAQMVDEPRRAVDLLDRAERSKALLFAQAQAAGVSVVLDTASLRHTQVEVIANRLQQVLNNLVGNAIKYNRRGGSVLVSAQLGADARVGLTVADNGIGMSAEQVAGLFRPFNRLGHREAVGGFGYGLVVVHRLVLAMGGTIHVNSEPGAGTVFTVWLRAAVHQGALDTLADVSLDSAHGALPAHDASGTGAADGPDRGVPRDGRAGSRLLLVDDDELNHVLIRHYAGSVPGLEVDGAYDADTALAAWQLHQRNGGVQLLVLDLHLGRASGEQLLERLRAAGYGGPAVAYTGDAAAVVASGDPRRGFCAVWEKPMRLEDFRRRVPALLGNTSWH